MDSCELKQGRNLIKIIFLMQSAKSYISLCSMVCRFWFTPNDSGVISDSSSRHLDN